MSIDRPRKPGEPGYLGPATEAERAREMVRGANACHRRPKAEQDDPAALALFAAALEPSLF